MSEHIMIGIVLVSMFSCVAFVLSTALRTWGRNRRDKHLGELQAKLLDKLGTGSEVMQFVSSDAYRQLIAANESGGNGSAARVLNSMQSGLVMLCLGAGMMLVSGISGLGDARQFLQVMGGLVLAVGVGLAASAGWSYALLKRWGLLEQGHSTK